MLTKYFSESYHTHLKSIMGRWCVFQRYSVQVLSSGQKHILQFEKSSVVVMLWRFTYVPELTDSPNIFTSRLFPVFHAYMAGIVQVLDQNQEWGGELLNLTLQLLLFCAAPKPQKRTHIPEFSLVRIPLDIRQTWLMACLIILYKVMSFKPDHNAP